jgi:hypothetical protein
LDLTEEHWAEHEYNHQYHDTDKYRDEWADRATFATCAI